MFFIKMLIDSRIRNDAEIRSYLRVPPTTSSFFIGLFVTGLNWIFLTFVLS